MGTPSKVTLASPARPWLIAYLVVAVVDMVARLVHAEVIDLIGLVLAMPALAGVLLASRPQRTRMIWLVLVSLFFFIWILNLFAVIPLLPGPGGRRRIEGEAGIEGEANGR